MPRRASRRGGRPDRGALPGNPKQSRTSGNPSAASRRIRGRRHSFDRVVELANPRIAGSLPAVASSPRRGKEEDDLDDAAPVETILGRRLTRGLVSSGQQAFVGVGAYGLFVFVDIVRIEILTAVAATALSRSSWPPSPRSLRSAARRYFAVGTWSRRGHPDHRPEQPAAGGGDPRVDPFH